jgi:hypothetical protein
VVICGACWGPLGAMSSSWCSESVLGTAPDGVVAGVLRARRHGTLEGISRTDTTPRVGAQ